MASCSKRWPADTPQFLVARKVQELALEMLGAIPKPQPKKTRSGDSFIVASFCRGPGIVSEGRLYHLVVWFGNVWKARLKTPTLI
jgi:hypothetical protein